MERHLIINSDIKNSLQFLEGLKRYDIIIIDDLTQYSENKNKLDSLLCDGLYIYISNKPEFEELEKLFKDTYIKEIKFKNIYAYVIGSTAIKINVFKLANCSELLNESNKDNIEPFTLYSMDNRYSYVISKIFKIMNVENVEILDTTTNESISQYIVIYGNKKNDVKLTRTNDISYKTEMNCKIYTQTYKKIDIFK